MKIVEVVLFSSLFCKSFGDILSVQMFSPDALTNFLYNQIYDFTTNEIFLMISNKNQSTSKYSDTIDFLLKNIKDKILFASDVNCAKTDPKEISIFFAEDRESFV